MEVSDYLEQFSAYLANLPANFAAEVEAATRMRLVDKPHGDMSRWQQGLAELPEVTAALNANADQISLTTNDNINKQALRSALMQLSPWRKGPFNFFGIEIDSEWHSDWKWQRLKPHISSLQNRKLLDVGCGSGYHCWRMAGEGAAEVLGIDPTVLYFCQYLAVKSYCPTLPVWFSTARLEQLTSPAAYFDSVFSMGVLYHQKSPLEHLLQLKRALRSGGELVLETLVVDGDEQTLLMPEGRYAVMRNVWFLPSALMLMRWLRRLGFTDVHLVDVNVTTIEEQRSTEWMPFLSLSDFLDPTNPRLTREGYPSPVRAIIIATAP